MQVENIIRIGGTRPGSTNIVYGVIANVMQFESVGSIIIHVGCTRRGKNGIEVRKHDLGRISI